MNCHQCSKSFADTSKFCPHCGCANKVEIEQELKDVHADEAPKQCPECGFHCKLTAKFCPRCSHSLSAVQAASRLSEDLRTLEVAKFNPQNDSDAQPFVEGLAIAPEHEELEPALPPPLVNVKPRSNSLHQTSGVALAEVADSATEDKKHSDAVTGHGNDVSSILWKKMVLVFVLFLIALGVATWYVMRNSEEKVIKNQSEIPTAKQELPAENPPAQEILKDVPKDLGATEIITTEPVQEDQPVITPPVAGVGVGGQSNVNRGKSKDGEKPVVTKKVAPTPDRSVIY